MFIIGQDAWQLKEQRQFGIHLRMVLLDHHQVMTATPSDLLGDLSLGHACIHRRHRPGQVARGEQLLAGGDLVALARHLDLSQGLTAAMLDQTDQMGPVAMRAGRTHTLAVDRLALHDLAVRADDATGIRRCGGQTGDQMRHLLFKNIGIDLA